MPRAAVPILPAIPALPKAKAGPKETKPSPKTESVKKAEKETAKDDVVRPAESSPTAVKAEVEADSQPEKVQLAAPPAPKKTAPLSWAKLAASSLAAPASSAATGQVATNGGVAESTTDSDAALSNFGKSNASSVAEVLQAYKVNSVHNLAFLEPRGLINTGNMCYMNSVSLHAQYTSGKLTNIWTGSASSSLLHSILRLLGPGWQEGRL